MSRHVTLYYIILYYYGTTVLYAVRRWPKRRYAAHSCTGPWNWSSHCPEPVARVLVDAVGGGGDDDHDDSSVGAFLSVYWYSPAPSSTLRPAPCVTAPQRCPLATRSGDHDKHSYGKIRWHREVWLLRKTESAHCTCFCRPFIKLPSHLSVMYLRLTLSPCPPRDCSVPDPSLNYDDVTRLSADDVTTLTNSCSVQNCFSIQ